MRVESLLGTASLPGRWRTSRTSFWCLLSGSERVHRMSPPSVFTQVSLLCTHSTFNLLEFNLLVHMTVHV